MEKVPVLVLAFNRSDHVAKAMKAIREYRPERLYLACDGPRANKEGDKEAVEVTRKTMIDAVDWPCQVQTLFRENNIGCAHAIYEAITWFFENEEYGIICEDDIILGKDFFRLCEKLLPRYARIDRIMEITSRNHSYRTDIPNSYVYSYHEYCWGWASWARAWKKMDMTMSAVPKLTYRRLWKRYKTIEGLIRMHYWKSGYKNINTLNSWATRWNLCIQVNDGLTIIPGVNLSKNIGTDGGVHYKDGDVDPYANLSIGKLEWPLLYDDTLIVDKEQARMDYEDFMRLRIIGIKKKINKIFRKK